MNNLDKNFSVSNKKSEGNKVGSESIPTAKINSHRFIATDTLILFFIALTAGIACWYLKGPAAVGAAVRADFQLLLQIIPLIVAGLALAGLVEVLVPKEIVTRWLGRSSGFRGLLLATVAGAMTPGGPFSSFPIVLALQRAGADIGTMVAFITAWSVIGINRMLIWEIPFFETNFLLVRFFVSIPLPFIAGLIARCFFSRIWERSELTKS